MNLDDLLLNAHNEISNLEIGVVLCCAAAKDKTHQLLTGLKDVNILFYEHVVKRPFLGWVLPKENQIEKCRQYNLPKWALTAYSLIEAAVLVPRVIVCYKILGYEVNLEFSNYASDIINISKNIGIGTLAGIKTLSLCDSVSRSFELTVWPKRPRASIIGGSMYRLLYRYPSQIYQSEFFKKHLTKGIGKVVGKIYRRKEEEFKKKFEDYNNSI